MSIKYCLPCLHTLPVPKVDGVSVRAEREATECRDAPLTVQANRIPDGRAPKHPFGAGYQSSRVRRVAGKLLDESNKGRTSVSERSDRDYWQDVVLELDKELTRETEIEDGSDDEVCILARNSPANTHHRDSSLHNELRQHMCRRFAVK